jgi:hypothetical protein
MNTQPQEPFLFRYNFGDTGVRFLFSDRTSSWFNWKAAKLPENASDAKTKLMRAYLRGRGVTLLLIACALLLAGCGASTASARVDPPGQITTAAPTAPPDVVVPTPYPSGPTPQPVASDRTPQGAIDYYDRLCRKSGGVADVTDQGMVLVPSSTVATCDVQYGDGVIYQYSIDPNTGEVVFGNGPLDASGCLQVWHPQTKVCAGQ